MSKINFTTNPIALSQLLQAAQEGQMQLPDFQSFLGMGRGTELVKKMLSPVEDLIKSEA